MDPFPGEEQYRGLGRKPQEWTLTARPEPAPSRSYSARASEVVLVGALGAFLLVSFAPWQRICLNLSTSFFHLNGCFTANAWSGSGGGFGVAAGVTAILACMALVLHLTGTLEGDTADLAERVLVYTTVGTGGVKWLLVITKAAALGAWIGLLVLFVIAAVETIRVQGSV